MKTLYKFKTIFQIKPDVDSDQVLAEFENDEIVTTDRYNHDAFFGQGNRLANMYISEHGGVIVRKVMCTYEQYDYSEGNGVYIPL